MSNVGPPPPPPPGLTPPPGYAAYQPRPIAQMALRRIGGLRTAMVVLLGVFAVGSGAQAALLPNVVDAGRDLLAGRIDEDGFNEELLPFSAAGFLTGGATIAVIVLTMIWLFRIAANHRALGRRLTWGPGWAIGGWFLPPLVLYIIPLLMLRESWKAADRATAPGEEGWKGTGESPFMWVWWVLYGLAPIAFIAAGLVAQFGSFSQDVEDVADSLVDQRGLLIAQQGVNIVAALAWALVVWTLTARHTSLTGEIAGR